ncbi:putative lipase domain-containing protein [Neospora caninum Liverpool]|uniref:Lipase domain-containing protein, putative n=1 Tax=Neospora caninum (strain Liverpool) TaxID=572307 RepID=F0VGB1_NEOCL|nr:putative lipase domain-containing protein [Neospora caninum Liverpool]CBZ52755.1 putative lipase domain-containing protein [Neospora caninum Liverpool]CEL66736.1 TPA: lipase domain-containing protein, putative [Neospora caninum Liverpool]|eukprot:XP_003882787.1 putative lipase domain-containing protein [Neospora caninum Liverpool]
MGRLWRSPTLLSPSASLLLSFLLSSLLFFLLSAPPSIASSVTETPDAAQQGSAGASLHGEGHEPSRRQAEGDANLKHATQQSASDCEAQGQSPCPAFASRAPSVESASLPRASDPQLPSSPSARFDDSSSDSPSLLYDTSRDPRDAHCGGKTGCARPKRARLSAGAASANAAPTDAMWSLLKRTATAVESPVPFDSELFVPRLHSHSLSDERDDEVHLSQSLDELSTERGFPDPADEATDASLAFHFFNPLYVFFPPGSFVVDRENQTSSGTTTAVPLVWGARFTSPYATAQRGRSPEAAAAHAASGRTLKKSDTPEGKRRRHRREHGDPPVHADGHRSLPDDQEGADPTNSRSRHASGSSVVDRSSAYPKSFSSLATTAFDSGFLQTPESLLSSSHLTPAETPASSTHASVLDAPASPSSSASPPGGMHADVSASATVSTPRALRSQNPAGGSPSRDSRESASGRGASLLAAASSRAARLPPTSFFSVVFPPLHTLETAAVVTDLRRLGEDALFDAEAVRHQAVCGGLFHWLKPEKKGGSSDFGCVWDRFADAFERTLPADTPLPFRPGGFTFKTLDTVNRWYSRFQHPGPTAGEAKSDRKSREKLEGTRRSPPPEPPEAAGGRAGDSSAGLEESDDWEGSSSSGFQASGGSNGGDKKTLQKTAARRNSATNIFDRSQAFLNKASRLLGKRLTSFVWGLVQRLVAELKKQQRNGGPLNLGKAVNAVIEAENVTNTDAMENAMFIPLGCKAHVHYSELYTEGYDVAPTDPSSWPDFPLFAWLLKDKSRAEILLPHNPPRRLTVTVAPHLPEAVEDKGAHLALYRLWHTVWFLIIEVSRADFLWPWTKHRDVDHLFPWWTVSTVGLHRVTEHRPVRYANGVWRFKNIDPTSLEVIPQPDGSESNPFEVVPPPRSHMGELDPSDNLATTGGEEQNPWGFLAEGLYANMTAAGKPFQSRGGRVRPIAKPKTFLYRGRSMSIYPDQCGQDATFSYTFDAPFGILYTPSHLLERVKKRQQQPGGVGRLREQRRRERDDSKQDKAHEAVQGNLVDAVWAFKPTTMPKMWLVNRLAKPMERELALSDAPDALVHRGYGILFRTSYRPRMEDFISQLTSPVSPASSADSSSLPSQDALWQAYQQRSRAHPFTVVFAGHSQGGVAAEMSAFFFAKTMKEEIESGRVRAYVVVFGTPVWCTQKMYDEFRATGLVIHEVVSDSDPVPFFFNVSEFAQDRNMVMLKLEDFYKVSFTSPFPFDGSIWKKPRRSQDKKTRLIGATFGIQPLLDPTVSFGMTHSHIYAASLGLLSQRYKHIGWANFLAFPLVPPEFQTSPPHIPEGMRGLQEGYRLLLMGAGVRRSTRPGPKGFSLLRPFQLRKRPRESTDDSERPRKRQTLQDKKTPEKEDHD